MRISRDPQSHAQLSPGTPIKALHLLKTSVGATWALRQMRELVRLGVRVHVILPPGGPLVDEYRATGIIVHEASIGFAVRSPGRLVSAMSAVRRLVAEINPDIIHSHFVATTLTMRLALGRGHRTPRLFQVPGPLHLEHPFFRGAELATAGPRDYWMGSCRWTCDRYRRSGVAPDQVFLSYYGIDLEQFLPRERGKLRRELGVGPETPIVGMVAYLYAPKRYLGQSRGLKGHEDLIDAVALVAERRPDVRCVIVGGPWGGATAYEARVVAYAKQRCGDRVVFLGTRRDVADLYGDFDVAVHPSHSENVGGAAESLPLGVPTIATNVGGFPDLVKPGDTGWLVPPRDPPALAAAIEEALRDPARARQMARRGQEVARELFDVRRCAADVLNAYDRILAHPAVVRCGNVLAG